MALKQSQPGNLAGDAMFDREPVELFQNTSDVCVFRGTDDKSGLHSSEHAEVFKRRKSYQKRYVKNVPLIFYSRLFRTGYGWLSRHPVCRAASSWVHTRHGSLISAPKTTDDLSLEPELILLWSA